MKKRMFLSVFLVLILIMLTLTGCIRRETRIIKPTETFDRLPKFVREIEDILNNYNIYTDYSLEYTSFDEVRIYFYTNENFNRYFVDLSIYNTGSNERFLMEISWNPSKEKIFIIDDNTLKLITDIISEIIGEEITDKEISNYLDSQKNILTEKNLINNSKNFDYEYYKGIEIHSHLNNNLTYSEYISFKGQTKDDV